MLHTLCLVVLVATVSATREILFKNCKSPSGLVTCKVKSVEINGCLDPSSWVDKDGNIIEYEETNVKSPCRIDKGSKLNFSIAFEPGFPGSLLHSQFSMPNLTNCWALQSTETFCPFWEPMKSGCLNTKCPLVPGREQLYETQLRIQNNFISHPVNFRKIYELKWKLWSKSKKNSCCFTTLIQY